MKASWLEREQKWEAARAAFYGSADGQPCKRGQSAARTGCTPAQKGKNAPGGGGAVHGPKAPKEKALRPSKTMKDHKKAQAAIAAEEGAPAKPASGPPSTGAVNSIAAQLSMKPTSFEQMAAVAGMGESGMSPRDVSKALAHLLEKGDVERVGQGKFRWTGATPKKSQGARPAPAKKAAQAARPGPVRTDGGPGVMGPAGSRGLESAGGGMRRSRANPDAAAREKAKRDDMAQSRLEKLRARRSYSREIAREAERKSFYTVDAGPALARGVQEYEAAPAPPDPRATLEAKLGKWADAAIGQEEHAPGHVNKGDQDAVTKYADACLACHLDMDKLVASSDPMTVGPMLSGMSDELAAKAKAAKATGHPGEKRFAKMADLAKDALGKVKQRAKGSYSREVRRERERTAFYAAGDSLRDCPECADDLVEVAEEIQEDAEGDAVYAEGDASGQPCKQGQSAASTGCVPAGGASGGAAATSGGIGAKIKGALGKVKDAVIGKADPRDKMAAIASEVGLRGDDFASHARGGSILVNNAPAVVAFKTKIEKAFPNAKVKVAPATDTRGNKLKAWQVVVEMPERIYARESALRAEYAAGESKGQPCKRGQSAARSGCIPAKKGASGGAAAAKAEPTAKPKAERKPREKKVRDPETMTPAQINSDLDALDKVHAQLHDTRPEGEEWDQLTAAAAGGDEGAQKLVAVMNRKLALKKQIVRRGAKGTRFPQGFRAKKQGEPSATAIPEKQGGGTAT